MADTVINKVDVTNGLEPKAIPLLDLSFDQVVQLSKTFHTYVTDSVLPDGSSIASHPGPVHRDANNDDEDKSDLGSDDGEEWICSCGTDPNPGLGLLCSASDGDTCECVGLFGNFYSRPPRSEPHEAHLNFEALPPNLPLVECSPQCPCFDRCTNRLTQLGIHAPLSVKPATTGIGLGLFHTHPDPTTLAKGTFISLYAGEYLSTSEARIRWANATAAEEGEGNYILSLKLPDAMIHIDPRHVGNIGRFLNHSCEPNCLVEVVRWGGVEGWSRAAIFTKRAIRPGEELTFDYANASGTSPSTSTGVKEAAPGQTRCLCQSSTCSGYMPYDPTL